MIRINDFELKLGHFPDNTQTINLTSLGRLPEKEIEIVWNYENDEEMISLFYIVNNIRERYSLDIVLHMPYIPNARMDRTKNYFETFTLKYFCDFINSLKFKKVFVRDVHSDVSKALIDRVKEVSAIRWVDEAIDKIFTEEEEIIYLFFPDAGSKKRYAPLISDNYISTCLNFSYGEKERNWETGEILDYKIIGDYTQANKILIVDDICCKGGTFLNAAKHLKRWGIDEIYLYVTHLEKAVLDGELINSGFINKIYTSDSLLEIKHELIEVIYPYGKKPLERGSSEWLTQF